MIWALLAAFLRKRPAWVQAAMVGTCTGLFVAAGTLGVARLEPGGAAGVLVPAVALPVGGAYYLALRAHPPAGAPKPGPWARVVYVVLWLALFSVAVLALLGAGGPRVAVFAIVPLVLLAAPALAAARGLAGTVRHREGAGIAAVGRPFAPVAPAAPPTASDRP